MLLPLATPGPRTPSPPTSVEPTPAQHDSP
jgi:hypothetical protein